MTRKRLNRILLAAAFAAMLLAPAESWAQKGNKPGGGGGGGSTSPSYAIVKLDEAGGQYIESWAGDVSDAGQMVGWVRDAGNQVSAACWTFTVTGGKINTFLSLLPGGAEAGSNGIHELGEIVGSGLLADGTEHGLYWDTALSAPLGLPPLPGHGLSVGLSISKDGVICGWSATTADPNGTIRAVAWRINADAESGVPWVWGPVELPSYTYSAIARSVNDNDGNGNAEIVGSADSTLSVAMSWNVHSKPDGTLDVDTPSILDANAAARAINNLGVICGNRWPPESAAVVWDASGSTLLPMSQASQASAEDLNTTEMVVGDAYFLSGKVKGYRAVMWPGVDAQMIPLDQFLTSSSGFSRLSMAKAVNDAKVIVGYGLENSGATKAFLAIPK